MAVLREQGEISRVFGNYRQLAHISRHFARFARAVKREATARICEISREIAHIYGNKIVSAVAVLGGGQR